MNGILGRIYADKDEERRSGRHQPGKIGRISETQRLRDEAALLKQEVAGASATRKQEIAKRMVALTAELELMSLGWEESTAADIARAAA